MQLSSGLPMLKDAEVCSRVSTQPSGYSPGLDVHQIGAFGRWLRYLLRPMVEIEV
jgi:hypothetical protein